MPASDPSAPTDPSNLERVTWIDAARGIGIVLVVYGHAIRGQIAAHLLPNSPVMQLQDSVIYAFHMPLFFFLSGLVSGRVLEGRRLNFVQSRMITLVYPYFLWSIIQIALSSAASAYANTPHGWSDFQAILWRPVGQFWFLYALALCQAALLLPRRAFYGLLPFAIALKLAFGDGNMLLRAAGFLPFFALGVWLTASWTTRMLAPRSTAAILFTAGTCSFAALAFAEMRLDPTQVGYPFRTLTAFAGVLMTVGLARLATGQIDLLTKLGRVSMPIFLMHVIAAAAVRSGLKALHFEEPVIALLIVAAGGLLLPIIFYQLAERTHLSAWLGFGIQKKPVGGSTAP
jgi:fucose 4-O-acetylase-like acetyltransferase